MFPYELDWTTNNTVDACLNQCAAYGYPAAGLEYGEQCCEYLPSSSRPHLVTLKEVCGDISDVTANGGTYVADSQCNMACSGDPVHLCGGGNRLTTYYWTGTPLYTWNTPENTGYYEASVKSLYPRHGMLMIISSSLAASSFP